MSGVYSLSTPTAVEITFALQKNRSKSNETFQTLSFAIFEKLSNFSSFLCTYHSQRYFIKAFYCLL